MNDKIFLYDTTLRDGGQTSGVSFTVEDKKKIYNLLSDFGFDFIEAGWPGANEVDTKTFDHLKGSANLVAFGMTKKSSSQNGDEGLMNLLNSGANTITIVAKSWDFHVKHALEISLEENLKIISDSVVFLKKKSVCVMVDMEHFFDGYKNSREYSHSCIKTAVEAGADWIVLCDTNGGSMPSFIFDTVKDLTNSFNGVKFGIHAHNDCEMAVANSVAAVEAGAILVQGTINGLGERCGNANLISLIPILQLKMQKNCGISPEKMQKIGLLSRQIDAILGRESSKYTPFVGSSAFAHKGGLHASAVLKNSTLYEHINPDLVGGKRQILVSNQSGRSNIVSTLHEAGFFEERYFSKDVTAKIILAVKNKEAQGFSFENANASFVLLVKQICDGLEPDRFFKVLSYKILTSYHHYSGLQSEAIIKVKMPDQNEILMASEGDGPVSALNNAWISILKQFYPELSRIKLTDYKVRIVSHGFLDGTDSLVRTSIEYTDTKTLETWNTVGVGTNSTDAAFNAICDATIFFLSDISDK